MTAAAKKKRKPAPAKPKQEIKLALSRNPQGIIELMRRAPDGVRGVGERTGVPLPTIYAIVTRLNPPYKVLRAVAVDLGITLERATEAWNVAKAEHEQRSSDD